MCRKNAQFNYMDWIGISIVFDILTYIHILHRYIVSVYIYIILSVDKVMTKFNTNISSSYMRRAYILYIHIWYCT